MNILEKIEKYLGEETVVVKKCPQTKLWGVYIKSPVAKGGMVLQGEWKTKEEAVKDAKNWSKKFVVQESFKKE